jgi:hypothetical protein
MIKANLNNKKYEIPQRFTIDTWSKMIVWDFEEPTHWKRIISAGVGIPIRELNNTDEESMQLFIGFLIAHMNQREQVKLNDFNAITFGQFIDLDCYIAMGIDKNIQSMLDVLELAPQYSDEALWVIDQYVMWRTTIFRQYKTLFGLNDKDFEVYADDQEDEDFDPMSIPRGWYKVIVDLAQENILNIDAVTDQPLKKALNFMALQKEKQLAEAEAMRKQKQKI